jgi:hypothetical protein
MGFAEGMVLFCWMASASALACLTSQGVTSLIHVDLRPMGGGVLRVFLLGGVEDDVNAGEVVQQYP